MTLNPESFAPVTVVHPETANAKQPRNLVLCCDGTSNEFGRKNTNVVRLLQCLQRDAESQWIYYDPGVGTLPEPNRITRMARLWSKVAGLAFGAGLTMDVMQAYAYLMDQWELGDRVYIFGFSRGAYTARVLSGLLHTFGLLPRGAHNLLPYVTNYFRALSDRSNKDEMAELETTYRDFRRTFARPAKGRDDLERNFPVHFLGVWDTVSSVGWVWDPKSFRHTAFNPSVAFARHAIAIDERRVFFRQNRLSPGMTRRDGTGPGESNGLPRLVEGWFAGSHCDVGGGNAAADDKLWPISLEWMLREAVKAQLLVDENRMGAIFGKGVCAPVWTEQHHESLVGLWKWAEYFPAIRRRKDYLTGEWRARIELGKGTPRKIRAGELIHRSVLQRLREDEVALPPDGRKGRYDPRSLCAQYKDQVRNIPEPLPEFDRYEPANCGCEACRRLESESRRS